MIHICLVAMILLVKSVSFINSHLLKLGGKIIFFIWVYIMPLGKDGKLRICHSIATQYSQRRSFHMTQSTETSLFRSLLLLLKSDSKLKTVLSTIIQTPLSGDTWLFLPLVSERVTIVRFHITSRRPYWRPRTILWEVNSFLVQTLSFVAIEIFIHASHMSENALYGASHGLKVCQVAHSYRTPTVFIKCSSFLLTVLDLLAESSF